jgi:hypothetical protein
MDRTLLELEAATKRNARLSLSAALRKPFSRLEMIARILKANPEAGEALLTEESLNVPMSYQALREHYYDIREKMRGRGASMSVGQRTARTFVNDIYNKVRLLRIYNTYDTNERARPAEQPAVMDFSEWKIAKWPGGYTFAHPDFIVVHKNRKAICGFQCKGLLQSPSQFDDIISRTAFESTFFHQYFVVAPSGNPIMQLASMIKELALLNVGILVLHDAKLEIFVTPTGEPLPDRRTLLLNNSYVMMRIGAALG